MRRLRLLSSWQHDRRMPGMLRENERRVATIYRAAVNSVGVTTHRGTSMLVRTAVGEYAHPTFLAYHCILIPKTALAWSKTEVGRLAVRINLAVYLHVDVTQFDSATWRCRKDATTQRGRKEDWVKRDREIQCKSVSGPLYFLCVFFASSRFIQRHSRQSEQVMTKARNAMIATNPTPALAYIPGVVTMPCSPRSMAASSF